MGLDNKTRIINGLHSVTESRPGTKINTERSARVQLYYSGFRKGSKNYKKAEANIRQSLEDSNKYLEISKNVWDDVIHSREYINFVKDINSIGLKTDSNNLSSERVYNTNDVYCHIDVKDNTDRSVVSIITYSDGRVVFNTPNIHRPKDAVYSLEKTAEFYTKMAEMYTDVHTAWKSLEPFIKKTMKKHNG